MSADLLIDRVNRLHARQLAGATPQQPCRSSARAGQLEGDAPLNSRRTCSQPDKFICSSYNLYEAEKQRLAEAGLSPAEYERAILELVRQVGI